MKSEKKDSLVDIDLFELTLQQLKPKEPFEDRSKRAVVRMMVSETQKKGETAFFPNLEQLSKKLPEHDPIPKRCLHQNREFIQELAESNHRITLVQRGIPLYRLLKEKEEKPKYKCIDIKTGITQVEDFFQQDTHFGTPRSRQISFVQPITAKPPDRVILSDRISISQHQRQRLQHLIKEDGRLYLRLHNDMINHLNHVNERRNRAIQSFYDDVSQYGIEIAQKNYLRASQKSRLRILSDVPWWNEFIEFAYEKNVTHIEESFIKQISDNPFLNGAKFVKLKKKFQSHPKYKNCLRYLQWINDKNHFVPEETIELLIQNTKTTSPTSKYPSPSNKNVSPSKNNFLPHSKNISPKRKVEPPTYNIISKPVESVTILLSDQNISKKPSPRLKIVQPSKPNDKGVSPRLKK